MSGKNDTHALMVRNVPLSPASEKRVIVTSTKYFRILDNVSGGVEIETS